MKLSISTRDYLPLALVIITGLLFIFNASVSDILIYDRGDIERGELWRLFTGNLLHSNLYHWLLNCAGLIMLLLLHGQHYTTTNYAFLTLFSFVGCAIGLYFLSPEMHRYVGLSGALHGIFVWGAIKDIQRKWLSGYLLLIGVIVKISWEQLYGASADLEDLIDSSVAINAHLYGAAVVFIVMLPQLLTCMSRDIRRK